MSERAPILPPPAAPGTFLQRSDFRLALFGATGVAAVYVGFLAVPWQAAEMFVTKAGYYVIAGSFVLFLHALARLARMPRAAAVPLTRRERWLTAALIGALTLMGVMAEPYHSKILNDEFVLQSTAFNLHYFRDNATMVRGYEIQGVFVSIGNYLDKRPNFYPFLVSLLHDLTGYRIANAFIVNSLLLPIAYALSFAFGRWLGGWRGGLLAVLLLGSLPLLGQNATGSGMELLNVVMILTALLLGAGCLRQPDEARVAAFVLTVVLLAQSRYESALYVAAAALVVGLGWVRAQRIVLPWQAILAPLLLVPSALQNKVLSNQPVLWELYEKTSRFSFDYLGGNLRGAWQFFLNRDAERANSLLLSIAGALALLGCLVLLMRRLRRAIHAAPAPLALACFGLVIVANTVLVLFYYWSNFNDPMASRFSLPLHLLLTFAVVIVATRCDARVPVTTGLLLAAGLWALPVAAGKFGHHYYSHLGIDEIEWQRRFLAARGGGPRIILSNRTSIPWLLQETPAILIDRARLVADRIEYQMRMPSFQEILVFQTLRPTTIDGDHQLPPEERLPSYFKLEPIAMKRFGTKLSRISRLVAVELPPDWAAPRKPDAAASGATRPASSE